MAINLVAFIIFLMAAAWPFQHLWNGVISEAVSTANKIGYWQSTGLLLVFWIAGRFFSMGCRDGKD